MFYVLSRFFSKHVGEGSGKGTSENPTPKDVPFWVTRNRHRDREMHASAAVETAATIAAVIASGIFILREQQLLQNRTDPTKRRGTM